MTWFPASLLKTTRRVDMLDDDAHKKTSGNIRKMRQGLATVNSNNFVVYGQKHKVWVVVFLVRWSGIFETKIVQIW